MNFLYIIVAVFLSIGVGTFAGRDADLRIIEAAQQNRAETWSRQAVMFQRAARREIQIDPDAFGSVAEGQDHVFDDAQAAGLDFGGYRTQGRFRLVLDASGRIVSEVTEQAIQGPNGLGSRAGPVIELARRTNEEQAIGSIDR